MQNVSRRIFLNLLWLTLSLSLTFVLAIVLFGWAFLKGELASWLPMTILLFGVTFIVYLIKAFKTEPTTTVSI
ncbi:MAG: hypothetical protein ABJA35_14505 [Parafilimonas sp.]